MDFQNMKTNLGTVDHWYQFRSDLYMAYGFYLNGKFYGDFVIKRSDISRKTLPSGGDAYEFGGFDDQSYNIITVAPPMSIVT